MTIVATLDLLKARNDEMTIPLRSLSRQKEKRPSLLHTIVSTEMSILVLYFFRPVSRSRSKSASPGYGKRNGVRAGSTGRRGSRSRSPGDN